MGGFSAISAAANVLAHVPGLVVRGTKPTSKITASPGEADPFRRELHGFEEAVGYPPHHVFIGNLRPEDLEAQPRPWYGAPTVGAGPRRSFGEFVCPEQKEDTASDALFSNPFPIHSFRT